MQSNSKTLSDLRQVTDRFSKRLTSLEIATTSPSTSSSSFSKGLSLLERPSRLNERTILQLKVSSFDSTSDLDSALLSRVVKCLEIVIEKNENSVDKDFTEVVEWVYELGEKVKESVGEFDLRNDFSNGAASSEILISSSNTLSQAGAAALAYPSAPSPTSASVSSSHALETREDHDRGVGFTEKRKLSNASEEEPEHEEEGEGENGDRRLALSKKRQRRNGSELGEDGDENSVGEFENEEFELVTGSRSFKLLEQALSTVNSYYQARRDHQPPLPDDAKLNLAKPYEQLYNDWIPPHSRDLYRGEKWNDLFDLAETENVEKADLLSSLTFMLPVIRDGFEPDMENLETYLSVSLGEHHRQANNKRRSAVTASLEPAYYWRKPSQAMLSFVASSLEAYSTSTSVSVRILAGSWPNSFQLARNGGCLGSDLAMGFGTTDRFDDDDDEQFAEEDQSKFVRILAQIKQTKKRKTRGTNKNGGSIEGSIRRFDQEFYLETESESILITTPLQDQIEKQVQPIFDEMESIFERLGKGGFWYVVKEDKGWTLARSDRELNETSGRVFVTET